MRRLVYSPRAYVFIKNADGDIKDISKYVVSGNVNRLLMQVSSAEVTLRNPKMIFTTPINGRVAFSPMDPITIYLKRQHGRPVRVFTGFLDKTPYLALYPGTVSLRASCTLKRLLYTFFDPALPYTQSFLEEYGWINRGDGTIYAPEAWPGGKSDSEKNLEDGSLAALLFATLTRIGHWDPEQVLIEKLPADLFTRMAELYVEITADQAELKKTVDGFLRKVVGEGDYAGSTQGSVDLSNIDGSVPEEVYKTGVRMAATDKWLLAAMETGLVEAPIQGGKSFGNPKGGDLTGVPGAPTTRQSAGWRQETVASYPGVDRNNVPESAARFFTECKQLDKGQSAGDLAADVQRPAAQYRGRYTDVQDTAATLLRKVAAKVKNGGAGALGAPNVGGLPDSATQRATRRDGRPSKGSGGSTKISSPLKGLTVESIGVGGGAYGAARSYGGHAGVDMPADYGQTLYSITDGVCVYAGPWGNEGQLTVIKSTQKVDNYPDDIRIGYGHMSSLSLKKDDQVTAGDPIGGAGHGSNGQNHLHLFVRQDDQPTNGSMDPTPLAKAAAKGTQPTGGPGTTATSGTSSATDVTNFGGAAAFAATLNFPSLMESMEAVALQGEKSLMNDKPLMPFVQQLTEASLREFQSMPDGSFMAFYPDYFGELYHRPPYWEIDDIEILDGNIDLSDDALTTHYYVVGDTSGVGNQLINTLFSSGVITVFNAFMANGLLTNNQQKPRKDKKGKEKGPSDLLLSKDEAIAFLNRYGARPQVDDVPMIRHPYFEMFLAYQRFMLAWAKQFSSPFTFTFMPELYPGGKVGFPDHSLQMYIEEVNHTWDYTSGFTTTATLSAPSVYEGKNATKPNTLPPRMVRAIIEPAITKSGPNDGN